MATTADLNALITLAQTLEVNSVVSVVATDAVLDEETGNWVRDIRIFREPDEGSTTPMLVLTVRLKGEEKTNVYLHAPEQDF